MGVWNAYPGKPLTVREWETLELIGEGITAKEAAAKLGIGHQTVKNHLRSIYIKLEVTTALGAFARLGWLNVPRKVR